MSKKVHHMAHVAKKVRKRVVKETEEGIILSMLSYALVHTSEKARLWASEKTCVWEEYSARKYRRQRPVSNYYEKDWGWGICARPFFSFCCKKINRPFNPRFPWSPLYWPFISLPSQLFTSSIWLMNMQMNNQFYNSLSFLKTGHKFGPQAGRSKETIILHGWGKRQAPNTTTSTPELFITCVNADRRRAPQSRAAARKGNLLTGSRHACQELSGAPEPGIPPPFSGGSGGGPGPCCGVGRG